MNFPRFLILLHNAEKCMQNSKIMNKVLIHLCCGINNSTVHGKRHLFTSSITKCTSEIQTSLTKCSIENVDLFNSKLQGPLEECKEDLSSFGKYLSPTYNVAAYANQSELVQQFAKLGVKVYKFDKDPELAAKILSLDFEKNVKPYIQFLDDHGVPSNELGNYFSKNPMILKEDLHDLSTRIRYLRAHLFSKSMITRIITRNPQWLTTETRAIDERLGYFQAQYKLTGSEIRRMTTMEPRLITLNPVHLVKSEFAITQEMGFSTSEIKCILLSKPRIWMMSRHKIVNSFDYAHNEMKLPHEIISKLPEILTCRKNRLQARHKFLQELGLIQYDSTKPKYISPKAVISGTDVEFCTNVAKVSVDTYNLFLKTL